MAITFELIDRKGELSSISLISTTASGIAARRGHLASHRLGAEQIDEEVTSADVVDSYALTVYGSTQNDAARRIQDLVKMLQKARRHFSRNKAQTAPVYLKAQTSSESSPRYAVVKGGTKFGIPDFFDTPFLSNRADVDVDLIREGTWRNTVPGTYPSLTSLPVVSGSQAKQRTTQVMVNFWGTGAVDRVYNYDSSLTAFSTNQANANSVTIWSVSGATPAAGDIIYFGSNQPFHTVAIPIGGTGGSFSATVVAEYWNGAWTALTPGTNFSYQLNNRAGIGMSSIFQAGYAGDSSGLYTISFGPGASWAKTTINGDSRYWVRLRLSAVTSWTVTPTTPADEKIWTVNKPYYSWAGTSSAGDAAPRVAFRLRAGSAEDQTGTTGSATRISRIILGYRSSQGAEIGANFQSHINLGSSGNTDGGWTTTYSIADTTQTTGVVYSGVGASSTCTFATATTMSKRIFLQTLTGADDYRGTFRAFLVWQGINFAATKSVQAKVRFKWGISDVSAGPPTGVAFFDSPTVKLLGTGGAAGIVAAGGWEVSDLGLISIPGGQKESYADQRAMNLWVEIWAERLAGSGHAVFDRLVLIPVDEFYMELDDNSIRDRGGVFALRDLGAVEADFGVMENRTVKMGQFYTGLYPQANWHRSAHLASGIRPGVAGKFYTLGMFYPVAFGDAPFFELPFIQLSVEQFIVNSYSSLRGTGA